MIKQSMILLLLVCGACAVAEEESLGEVSQNGLSYNGMSFNGISFNGISFNGTSLTGKGLSGVGVNGTSVGGAPIMAASGTAQPLTSASLVGSTWNGTMTDGATIKLRIDTAVAGVSPNQDLWFYGVSYQTSTGWSPLCGIDLFTGKPIQAVSVAGVWLATKSDTKHYTTSTTQFTLACRGATVGKCVELGYKTFKGYTDQLLSCVRLLRGDYCGTGSAYTLDGTLLNLYDNVGVQADTQAWAAEAEWTPSGARCINSANNWRFELVMSVDPKCVRRAESTTCGTTFANGAILIDELPLSFQVP
jgi:ADYC domain